MTEINEKTVEHVARLARLKLSEEEIKKFTKQLSDVLEAFKILDKVDTKSKEPSFHPQEIKNVWREDAVESFKWDPLENTKHKEGKHFRGPRIV